MIKLFLKVSLLGIFTAFFAVIAEQLVAVLAQIFLNQEIILSNYQNLTWFILLAVIIEEGSKYAILRYVMLDKFAVRGKKLVLLSFLMGLFFGLSEIGLIVFASSEVGSLLARFDREIIINLSSIVLIQSATSLLMGSLLATRQDKTKLSLINILIFPIFIHLLYNYLIIQKGNYTDFLVLFVLAFSYLLSFIVIVYNFRELD